MVRFVNLLSVIICNPKIAVALRLPVSLVCPCPSAAYVSCDSDICHGYHRRGPWPVLSVCDYIIPFEALPGGPGATDKQCRLTCVVGLGVHPVACSLEPNWFVVLCEKSPTGGNGRKGSSSCSKERA
jgi:hypothetical protein